jgi:hypothetical protein
LVPPASRHRKPGARWESRIIKEMLAQRTGEAANVIEGTAEPVVLPTAEAQSAPTPGPNIREAEPIRIEPETPRSAAESHGAIACEHLMPFLHSRKGKSGRAS